MKNKSRKNSLKLIAGSTIFSIIIGLSACGESNSSDSNLQSENSDTLTSDSTYENDDSVQLGDSVEIDTSSIEDERGGNWMPDQVRVRYALSMSSTGSNGLILATNVSFYTNKDEAEKKRKALWNEHKDPSGADSTQGLYYYNSNQARITLNANNNYSSYGDIKISGKPFMRLYLSGRGIPQYTGSGWSYPSNCYLVFVVQDNNGKKGVIVADIAAYIK